MQVEIKDGKMVITVPLSPTPELSKSGKSNILYSSGGFQWPELKYLDKGVGVSLNVIGSLKR